MNDNLAVYQRGREYAESELLNLANRGYVFDLKTLEAVRYALYSAYVLGNAEAKNEAS